MENYWRLWPRIKSDLLAEKRLLLIMDFDGTLSAYASYPHRARLNAKTRRFLERMAALDRLSVAIISGRSLEDIRRRVGIASFYYGGNHGLEMAGPGLSFIHPRADRCREIMRRIAQKARASLAIVRGAMVEDKGFSVTLHNRRVAAPSLDDFYRMTKRLREETRTLPVWWRKGQRVWEILPKISWHKGRAAVYLRRHLGQPWPIVVGDDRTDEDMFKAFPKTGWTIRVGHIDGSSARLHLSGQQDVSKFLLRFLEALEEKNGNKYGKY